MFISDFSCLGELSPFFIGVEAEISHVAHLIYVSSWVFCNVMRAFANDADQSVSIYGGDDQRGGGGEMAEGTI